MASPVRWLFAGCAHALLTPGRATLAVDYAGPIQTVYERLGALRARLWSC